MASWSGDLFVFTDGEGQQYVAALLPPGLASNVQRYQASGPNMPVGWKPEKVDDAAAWLTKKRSGGFEFRPVPL
jgi:hypothetical protein